MKAEELRIGNYVKVCDSDNADLLKVDSNDIINVEELEGTSDVKPVPLTEDWLLKLGFKKVDLSHSDGSISKGVYKNYPIVLQDNRLYEDKGRYIVSRFVPSKINTLSFLTHVDYVHQLQNLYFALTGHELELTS